MPWRLAWLPRQPPLAEPIDLARTGIAQDVWMDVQAENGHIVLTCCLPPSALSLLAASLTTIVSFCDLTLEIAGRACPTFLRSGRLEKSDYETL